MKDLTTLEEQSLLRKIKSFLSITWTDTDTDIELLGYIRSSIRRLDDVAGVDLDYLLDLSQPIGNEPQQEIYYSMCMLGQDLLLNRVFYMKEKGLDDFESNYQSELNSLFLYGNGYKRYVSEEENI